MGSVQVEKSAMRVLIYITFGTKIWNYQIPSTVKCSQKINLGIIEQSVALLLIET